MLTVALCALTVGYSLQAAPSVFDVNKEFELMAGKKIWPGFNAKSYPLAIFDGKKTYLFRHPSPPEPFKELADHKGVYVAEGREGVYSNTHATIGDKLTATAIMDLGKRTGLNELGALMIHEAFHCHQTDHLQTWKSNEVFLMTYPFENAENLALRRMETMALEQALNAKDNRSFRNAAQMALALRERRYKLIGPNDAKYERSVEIVEGTAQYVEFRAMGNSYKPVPKGEWAANEIRQRCYFSGQAWAMILDRLSKSWKDEMVEKEDLRLDLLAAEKLGKTDPIAKIDETTFTAQLEKAKKDIVTYKEFVKGQFSYFQQNPDWRIVVEAGSGKPLNCQGFDPWNYFFDGAKNILHIRYFKAAEGDNSLESINHRAMSTASGPHPLFAGLSRVEVCDLKTEPKLVTEGNVVTIDEDGFKAKFVGATITRDGKTITVKLGS